MHAKLFSQRGAEVWLARHERVEPELRPASHKLTPRIRLVRDTQSQKIAWRYSSILPHQIRGLLVDQAMHFSTRARIRKVAIELARAGENEVVFEPAPMTPKGPRFMYDVGVPVVIGPLCGGIGFPPAFADLDPLVTHSSIKLGHHLAQIVDLLVPGKLRADVPLAANAATAEALPAEHRGRVVRLFESGVDLDLWQSRKLAPRSP